MKKRPRMTLVEHQALGEELRALHARLVQLEVMLGNRYTARLGDRAARVTVALSNLRSDLDALVVREFPEEETQTLLRVYYGGQRSARGGEQEESRAWHVTC